MIIQFLVLRMGESHSRSISVVYKLVLKREFWSIPKAVEGKICNLSFIWYPLWFALFKKRSSSLVVRFFLLKSSPKITFSIAIQRESCISTNINYKANEKNQSKPNKNKKINQLSELDICENTNYAYLCLRKKGNFDGKQKCLENRDFDWLDRV